LERRTELRSTAKARRSERYHSATSLVRVIYGRTSSHAPRKGFHFPATALKEADGPKRLPLIRAIRTANLVLAGDEGSCSWFEGLILWSLYECLSQGVRVLGCW